MTPEQYLHVIWPLSLIVEAALSFCLIPQLRIRPWFSAFILFDTGRTLAVFMVMQNWPGLRQSHEYQQFFLISELIALPLLAMAAVEATPTQVRSWITGAAILGGSAVASLAMLPTREVWAQPAFAGRVWIEAVFLACAAARVGDLDSHGRTMTLFLGLNCIAYLAILLNPWNTTLAACFAITADLICYAVWTWHYKLNVCKNNLGK